MTHSSPLTEEPENAHQILVQVDNETSINQTELQLSTWSRRDRGGGEGGGRI